VVDSQAVPTGWKLRLRTLRLLPAAVTLLLVAVDPLTSRPCYWRVAVCEFDVVDARNRRPLPALVTMTYEGPLAGQPGSGTSYITLGEPYEKYRGMTPNVGYGGLACIVRHQPRTLIFRRRDLTITEGLRLRIEADGYKPFAFAPVDARGMPLEFETWDPPVFRVELSREGSAGVPASWSTRPGLEVYPGFPG
jgi:hypothetical protein